MPTLKEILAERKRKEAQSAQEVSADTQVQVTEEYVPQYAYQEPMSEWEALFADCTDF